MAGKYKNKQDWLDLLLQHGVPETMARSCIRDVTDEEQIIAKIKALESPGEGLLEVLSFPTMWYKRSWLNVFISHGLPAELSKVFLSSINGGLLDLEQTLRGFPIPQDLAEDLISKVCGDVSCGSVSVVVYASIRCYGSGQ